MTLSTIISILFINSIIFLINFISTLNFIAYIHNLSWLRRISDLHFINWYIEICRESSWPRGCEFPKALDIVNLKKLYIIDDLRVMNWMKELMNLKPMRAYITLAYKLIIYITQVFDQKFADFEKIVLFSLSLVSYIDFLLV